MNAASKVFSVLVIGAVLGYFAACSRVAPTPSTAPAEARAQQEKPQSPNAKPQLWEYATLKVSFNSGVEGSISFDFTGPDDKHVYGREKIWAHLNMSEAATIENGMGSQGWELVSHYEHYYPIRHVLSGPGVKADEELIHGYHLESWTFRRPKQ